MDAETEEVHFVATAPGQTAGASSTGQDTTAIEYAID